MLLIGDEGHGCDDGGTSFHATQTYDRPLNLNHHLRGWVRACQIYIPLLYCLRQNQICLMHQEEALQGSIRNKPCWLKLDETAV